MFNKRGAVIEGLMSYVLWIILFVIASVGVTLVVKKLSG